MKTNTIIKAILANKEDIIKTLEETVVRDSVYGTLIAFDADDESIEIWNGSPDNRMQTNRMHESDTTLHQLACVQFESPDEANTRAALVREFLEEIMRNEPACLDSNEAVIHKQVIDYAINNLVDEAFDSEEAAYVEDAYKTWDEANRSAWAEDVIDTIINEQLFEWSKCLWHYFGFEDNKPSDFEHLIAKIDTAIEDCDCEDMITELACWKSQLENPEFPNLRPLP